jgi:hypothetical protein
MFFACETNTIPILMHNKQFIEAFVLHFHVVWRVIDLHTGRTIGCLATFTGSGGIQSTTGGELPLYTPKTEMVKFIKLHIHV